MFSNRTSAGKLLAQRLSHHLSQRTLANALLVVGLPRGGVPVAAEVARVLQCPMELIVSKKLSYPYRPEYALGAVSSDGVVVLSPEIPTDRRWQSYVEHERFILLEHTRSTELQYFDLADCKRITFRGKTVILVDDGIATGMTAMAAAKSARERGAAQVILAAPVISIEAMDSLRTYCDDIVALEVPSEFKSVGAFYEDFSQTTSAEVINCLRSLSTSMPPPNTNGTVCP
ncbi:MAG: Pribosyltran protein [Cyanobacteriota bacterium erpe_2018_sw_39hr_WHONDRS-SW48-000098_B_bin.30]|jgi:putative phosphoribosyl transferase|nr:phosphoribosyltransferase [Candidatus Obscuribacter sp.]MDQ5966865.1 Pribosyltran protein [Cyanobacteriota bacterium erpe_2018_sw_39hr_WHONDRS-SW48-000098_B_bin.30]